MGLRCLPEVFAGVRRLRSQLAQQVRNAEAQRATHHQLAVAAHENVQRTHTAKQQALQHHELMQTSGSSEQVASCFRSTSCFGQNFLTRFRVTKQIEKARTAVQQTNDAYNAAQMQHRKEYHLYQEWSTRVAAYQNALQAAQQVRRLPIYFCRAVCVEVMACTGQVSRFVIFCSFEGAAA